MRAQHLVPVALTSLLWIERASAFSPSMPSPAYSTVTRIFSAPVENMQTDEKESQMNDKQEVKDDREFYIEDPKYSAGNVPESAFILGTKNFINQGSYMLMEALAKANITGETYVPPEEMPPECFGFTLDDEEVREAERRRQATGKGMDEVNPVSKALYDASCFALDRLFVGRPIARFWVLEEVARVPYFSFLSMLHLYESLGWLRQPELRQIHYAEEYNEFHHLLIMESLGGNARWRDRFLGFHIAIACYWAVNALFLLSPRSAYEYMALLETHAVDTYSTFFKENEDKLKSLPAPKVARKYYEAANLYLFDDFRLDKSTKLRHPPCDNLYDVFKNICEDEQEHVKTMEACKDHSKVENLGISPRLLSEDQRPSDSEKRQVWREWSEEVNGISTSKDDR